MKKCGPTDVANGTISDPLRVSEQQIRNWFEPRHALGLKDLLLEGVDRLDAHEVTTLVRLGQSHWRDDPPMFWFSKRQIKPLRSSARSVAAG